MTVQLAAELREFRLRVQSSPGHGHLYEVFDDLVFRIVEYRKGGGLADSELGRAIFETIDLLLTENSHGRRPWVGNWETYFETCMRDALVLLKEFDGFPDAQRFCPAGFCNRCLDMFLFMDKFYSEYSDHNPYWASHFRELALISAEMFSLVADSGVRIDADVLDNPDDTIFKHLLTGFAKSRSESAKLLLQASARDDERWVRELAQDLLRTYYS